MVPTAPGTHASALLAPELLLPATHLSWEASSARVRWASGGVFLHVEEGGRMERGLGPQGPDVSRAPQRGWGLALETWQQSPDLAS